MILKPIKAFVFASIIAVGSLGVAANSASASDCSGSGYSHSHGYYWKTITVYVKKCVPYQVKVRYVKPCGTVYYKWVTKYKTITVPVKKRIKVWY